MCPRRWREANATALAVTWTTPLNPNGVISTYYVRLLSFDNATVISEADSATLRADLQNVMLSKFLITISNYSTINPSTVLFSLSGEGVPYRVRVFAANGAGNGTFCTITDFANERSKLTCCCALLTIVHVIIHLSPLLCSPLCLSLSLPLSLSLSHTQLLELILPVVSTSLVSMMERQPVSLGLCYL